MRKQKRKKPENNFGQIQLFNANSARKNGNSKPHDPARLPAWPLAGTLRPATGPPGAHPRRRLRIGQSPATWPIVIRRARSLVIVSGFIPAPWTQSQRQLADLVVLLARSILDSFHSVKRNTGSPARQSCQHAPHHCPKLVKFTFNEKQRQSAQIRAKPC